MVRVTLPIEGFKEIEQRGKNVFFVRYDVERNEEEQVLECCESGVLIDGVPNYGKLVSAIISTRYDINAQIAILANVGDGSKEHEEEFKAFEAWRAKAKELAKSVSTEEE